MEPKIFLRYPTIIFLLILPFISSATGVVLADTTLKYVTNGETAIKQGAQVIDVRPLEQCLKKSVRRAKCLPIADFFGPHNRLASFVNINWLLGTAGLNGNEHVLVVGNNARERDSIAGILYITGQKKISILTQQMSQGGGFSERLIDSGIERSNTRLTVYQGIARDKTIIFKRELAQIVTSNTSTALVDGRSEKEFWGAKVRGLRGGHIVSARHLSYSRLRSLKTAGESIGLEDREIIIYGHNALEGFSLLTLMQAGFNIASRVYPGGWAEWSADSNMPVDATTYPERKVEIKEPQVPGPARTIWLLLILAFGTGILIATSFFFFARRWSYK